MSAGYKAHLLLINPWIFDFAAYDLWAQPLGLLYLASLLRNVGFRVTYIDCLDRYHSSLKNQPLRSKGYGCGKYYAEVVKKPELLTWMPRRYKRYGIRPEAFIDDLKSMEPPDAVLITSRITYWYQGVQEVISICRQILAKVPIILGGIYPTLCIEHCRANSGADVVVQGEGEDKIFKVLAEILSLQGIEPDFSLNDLDSLPYPAYDLLSSQTYLPLQTSRGCLMNCTYCAARIVSPQYRRRDPYKVALEIKDHMERFKTTDFAFYDDALLIEAENHFLPLLDYILKWDLRVRFHTPNGLACKAITAEVARKMFKAGFKTIRLSLETSDPERLKELNRAGGAEELKATVQMLRSAGFSQEDIGVYILYGLPFQQDEEIKKDIDLVIDVRATPRLAEFSPIPGTEEWPRAVMAASKNITDEPLLHNNSVYHRLSTTLKPEHLDKLRNYIKLRIG